MNYRFGSYRLDTDGRVVWLGTEIVRLPPKAIDFLICLVERDGGVVTRTEIRERVWPDTNVEEAGIAQIVSILRRALKPGFGDTEIVETVPRRGYRLAVPAIPVPAEPAPAEPVDQTVPPPEAESVDQPALVRRNARSFVWVAGVTAVAVVAGVIATTAYWSDRFRSAGPISVHPLTGSAEEEEYPDISADGSRVVYSARPDPYARFNLYVKLLDGGLASRITKADADDLCPVWSPDHLMVAFSRQFRDRREIRVIAPVGAGAERLVLTTAPNNFDLAWSPDGKWLIYNVYNTADAPTGGIFMVSLETSRQRRLTSPAATFSDMLPAISPDGQSVAFVRYTPILDAHDVYVIPVRGGDPVQVTREKIDIQGLAFSADGREVIFSSDARGAPRFFRVPVAKPGKPRPIEATGFSVLRPSIARQRNRMVYMEKYDNINIWRIPGPGRPPEPPRLVLSSSRTSHSQQYSPDGRRIVFISDRSGSTEVWVANADGTSPVRLTSFNRPVAGSPSWSPDGKYIAFDLSRPEDRKSDVYIVPSQGGTPTRFTNDPDSNRSPIWSPDGKWIYTSNSRSGDRQIWRYAWPAGEAQQMTFHLGYRHRESPDGKYIYHSKGDIPGIFRTPMAGGPEEPVSEMGTSVVRSFWTVTARGYYWSARTEDPFPAIRFFDFATKKTITLARGEAPQPASNLGIAVSPDEAWVIFPRVDRAVRRIMVAENFR